MGQNTIRTFSIQQVVITAGSLKFSGFAEGDGATFSWSGDDFEVQQGSDGEVLFIQKHNGVVEGMIRLTQGNDLIDQVNALHQASVDAGGLLYPMTYRELQGTGLITGSVLFKKFADKKAADTGQPVEIPFFLVPSTWKGGSLIPAAV